MLRAAFLGATCLALLLSQLQYAQGQMSLRDLRSLPKRRAASQARHDLDDTVIPKGEYPKGNYTSFVTRPYGTAFGGICARDVLSLGYAYTDVNGDADHGQGQISDHVPVKPYSISVKKEYAFVRTPDVEMLNETMFESGSQFRSECTSMKDNATWFSVGWGADGPKPATEAWLLLMKAIETAGTGTLH